MTVSKGVQGVDINDPVKWRDDGCEHSPKCLDCPLPICKYDVLEEDQISKVTLAHQEKWIPIVAEILRADMNKDKAAAFFGVNRRTLNRNIGKYSDA